MSWSPEVIKELVEFVKVELLDLSEEDAEQMTKMKMNRGQFLVFKFGKTKIKEIADGIMFRVIAAAGKVKLKEALIEHNLTSASPNPVFLSLQLVKMAKELEVTEDITADIQVNNLVLLVRDRNIFEFINGRDEDAARRKVRIEIKIAETDEQRNESVEVVWKGLVDFMYAIGVFIANSHIDQYRYY